MIACICSAESDCSICSYALIEIWPRKVFRPQNLATTNLLSLAHSKYPHCSDLGLEQVRKTRPLLAPSFCTVFSTALMLHRHLGALLPLAGADWTLERCALKKIL